MEKLLTALHEGFTIPKFNIEELDGLTLQLQWTEDEGVKLLLGYDIVNKNIYVLKELS